MDERTLAITIGDTQTVYATTDPQDQDRLAEIFGNSPQIQLREAEGDVEGHGLSDEILVDVEGHAIALRLPTPADAAALRRALAVTAVTATLVTAGAIASLQGATAPSATTIDNTRPVTQGAPAQMVRADEAQALREQGYANAQAAAQAAAIAEARNEIPTAQDRANYGNSQVGNSQVSSQTTQSSVNVNPAPALRADEAAAIREQGYAGSQANSEATSPAVGSDGDVVVPGPAQRADEAENLR